MSGTFDRLKRYFGRKNNAKRAIMPIEEDDASLVSDESALPQFLATSKSKKSPYFGFSNGRSGGGGYITKMHSFSGALSRLMSTKNDVVYVDPPMPKIGNPIDMDRLKQRHKKSRDNCEQILNQIDMIAISSAVSAKALPVNIQRIMVTKEIKDIMKKHNTMKSLREAKESNVNDIQEVLALRKKSIILMNENYSHVKVHDVDPVYVHEAMAIKTFYDHDVDEKYDDSEV
jgi:hypothetical protein